MFILHSSNKTENLLINLIKLVEVPSFNPFSKEIFLIQSHGMERWLSQQLASHFTVWGNYEFLVPSKFFSSIAEKIDNQFNSTFFDMESMLWKFEQLLRHLEDDCFKPLQQYISGENKELKRFQLANKLAYIFVQYQIMRPHMLEKWQQGKLVYQTKNEIWQQKLWHKMLDDNSHRPYVSSWQNIIKKLNQGDENQFCTQIPKRVFIFGLNTLPTLFIDYLQALSRHCDIHLFLLNPTQVYWADLANNNQSTQPNDHHPLLSILGQQGREFQQMLLEQVNFTSEIDNFEHKKATNLLQQLQNDILNNCIESPLKPKDNSISIHACHSKMREVEVLKDQLLLYLEQDYNLQLRDIVVMAPDIQMYSPFITAIFSDIQHAIADRSLEKNDTLLTTLISFLKLIQSRFGWKSVIDLLEQPIVYPSFSLVEADLELIRHWVKQTQIRWGKSGIHKQELGLPELEQNTWQSALERLLMGYANNADGFVDNILPYTEIEGSSAMALGGLNDFIKLLFRASDELKQEFTLSTWVSKLHMFAEQLFAVKIQTDQSLPQQLNKLLADLNDNAAIHTEIITLDVIINWLESRLNNVESARGILRGQLTFCSLLPMRSIPFKVIALLGMNAGEFPKIDTPLSFDLIGQNFQLGDRSCRTDERYQFLEVLLSVRQQLIISFVDQSSSNFSASVVINELLDVLESHYQCNNLITQHPLQAFSEQYFKTDSKLFSFSQTNCETALALQENRPKIQAWWQGKLETKVDREININDLFAFFQNPQRYFLQHNLGVYYANLNPSIAEREPFSIDALTEYKIDQQWVEQLLNNKPYPLKNLQAQGIWMPGIIGKQAFSRKQHQISKFVQSIKQQKLGQKIPYLTVDIIDKDYRLFGNLDNLYEQGCMLYYYTNLKGKHFMRAWLQYLLLNKLQSSDTYLFSKDEILIFSATNEQTNTLDKLVNIYLQGMQQPDIFFTEASFAYVKQISKRNHKNLAIVVARQKLKDEISHEPLLKQLYQHDYNLTKLLNADFENLCNHLILPGYESAKNNATF